MKKLHLTLAAILFAMALFSCDKEDLPTDTSAGDENIYIPQASGGGGGTGGGSLANPAIVWRMDETLNRKTSSSFWVMDANGANQTRLYNPSIAKGEKSIYGLNFPHWSPDGSSICFKQNSPTNVVGLYKLNVTLINGVPTATNVTMLYNATINNEGLSDIYWSFGPANEIIFIVSDKTNSTYRINAISANGGIPATLFSSSSDYFLSQLTVSPDGSKIAFTMNERSTGNKYLKVINRSDGSELYSIQYNSLLESILHMDWARTSGSNTIAFAGFPLGTHSYSLYTMDVTDANTLTLKTSTGGRAPSWSPDDTKIVYSSGQVQVDTIKTITLSNGTIATLSSKYAFEMHWKK